MTTEELDDKICALLGGRVAEEIIFGKISTGAQNDLERITNMAFAMVAEYGMSEELGYLSLKDSSSPENSYGFNKKYSEHTAQQIDEAVRNIIRKNYRRTFDLLEKHREKLDIMADTLLEKEVLNHHDLREMLGDRPSGNYPEGIFEDDSLSKASATNGSPGKSEEVSETETREEIKESDSSDKEKELSDSEQHSEDIESEVEEEKEN
jgi:cell division protease FtsH